MVSIEAIPTIAVRGAQKRRSWSLEKSFLLIGFVFGVIFLLTTPPFQVADESRHFARAYDISEAFLYRLGFIPSHDRLPESVVESIEKTEYMRFDPTAKTTVGNTLSLLDTRLNPQLRASYGEVATYPIISYLPQLLLLIPCRLAGLNPVVTLYAARFCALLFWLAITYLAIRRLPVAKCLLFFIALLPMTLFQAGSLSADCITLALSFLLIAQYVYLAYRTSYVRTKDLMIVIALGALLTASKLVYAPLIGLHFLIHPAKFRSWRLYIGTFILTGLVCLGTLLIAYSHYVTLFLGAETTAHAAPHTMPYPQLNFLLQDPLNVWRMVQTTGVKFGRTYMDGFVGILGWSGASFPSYLYVVTVLMILLTAFATDSRWVIRSRHKLILIGISTLITATICTALCTDTLLNNRPTYLLLGIQGRYLTPFAMLIFLLAVNRSEFARRYGRYVHAAVLPFVVFLLLNAVYFLIDHYYVI